MELRLGFQQVLLGVLALSLVISGFGAVVSLGNSGQRYAAATATLDRPATDGRVPAGLGPSSMAGERLPHSSAPNGDRVADDVASIRGYATAAATQLSLPTGATTYFYVGTTGGSPIPSTSWHQDLGVYTFDGNRAGSIGEQSSTPGSYGGRFSNYGIAGVAVNCSSSFQEFNVTANGTGTGGTHADLNFSVAHGDALVIVLIGAVGGGDLTMSGTALTSRVDATYNEGGADVNATVAIYAGVLPEGNYTGAIQTYVDTSTNAGSATGAVAYVFPLLYAVTFTEQGSPPGTEWFVNISGQPSLSSKGVSVATNLTNGSYKFKVATVNKKYRATGGSFTVAGAGLSKSVTFSRATFRVRVWEYGLPANVLAKRGWTVVLNGTRQYSQVDPINFANVPNGTYYVLVTGPSGYALSVAGPFNPAISNVTVLGPTSVGVVFEKNRTVTLTFAEKGLPKSGRTVQHWCVEVNAYQECTTKSSLKYLNLTAGYYTFWVASPLVGQQIVGQVKGSLGVILSGGRVTNQAITPSANRVALWFLYTYQVTFRETGLSSGTWSISIHGNRITEPAGVPIPFSLKNGTFRYGIGAEKGYKGVGAPTTVTVNGSRVLVNVTFTKKGSSASGTGGRSVPAALAAESAILGPTIPASTGAARRWNTG